MYKFIVNIVIGTIVLVISLGFFLAVGLLTASYPIWLVLPGGILFSYLAYGVGDLFHEDLQVMIRSLRKEKSKD